MFGSVILLLLAEGTLKAFTWKNRVCSSSKRRGWTKCSIPGLQFRWKGANNHSLCDLNISQHISTNLLISIPHIPLEYRNAHRWWVGMVGTCWKLRVAPSVGQALFQKQRSAEQDQNRLLGSIQDAVTRRVFKGSSGWSFQGQKKTPFCWEGWYMAGDMAGGWWLWWWKDDRNLLNEVRAERIKSGPRPSWRNSAPVESYWILLNPKHQMFQGSLKSEQVWRSRWLWLSRSSAKRNDDRVEKGGVGIDAWICMNMV